MIPGPYAICKTDMVDGGDGLIYTTLMWGYDTAQQAYEELASVAQEAGVSADVCAVIRHVDQEEAAQFDS